MKSWLLFGFGMFLGIFLGAVGASFFLYDDVTQAPPRAAKAAVTVSSPAARPRPASVPPAAVAALAVEARPVAVPAQAVDVSALSDVDAAVISTVRREATAQPASPTP
jgi:hypothetical protein